MSKRLKDIERERAQEERKARAWAEKHGLGHTPGRRLASGETGVQERSAWLRGDDQIRAVVEREPGTSRSITSYDSYESVDGWEQAQLHKQAGRKSNHLADEETVDLFDGDDTAGAIASSTGEQGGFYLPLTGQNNTKTPEQIARAARVEYVMSFLLPRHQDILRMVVLEGMTLEAVAEEFCCSYQNIQQVLAVAKQDFAKAWAGHAEDPIDIREGI